jgi:hypothetical protein
MAKRTSKTNKSTKQKAATRRTKKEATPIKKAPVKKTATEKPKTAISGNETANKTAKSEVKLTETAISGNETPKIRSLKNKPNEYVRLPSNAKREDFTAMGERVRLGEVQWAYYALDGDIGYHYYRILK